MLTITSDNLADYVDLKTINLLLDVLPGFTQFTSEDIVHFLTHPSDFSLSFKKETGKGYLYSLELAHLRRQLFNQLPKEFRNELILSRLHTHQLNDEVSSWVADSCDVEKELIHCIDIGMGSSVYKLEFGQKSCVLKPVQSVNGSFYSHILSLCDYPYIHLKNFSMYHSFWQLSDFLDGMHLNSFYNRYPLNDALIIQCAYHACLGDIFGRGDRHFENYLLSDHDVYVIDVSYLFWPNNDEWLHHYIAGGQSECCLLALHPEFATVYWEAYHEAFDYFKRLKELFLSAIHSFYLPGLAQRYEGYLLERLCDDNYPKHRRDFVAPALDIYQKRLDYKQRLEERFLQDPESLDPLLRMYYHANKDRLTAFFLLDYFKREELLDLI
jgi:hypothetical protein